MADMRLPQPGQVVAYFPFMMKSWSPAIITAAGEEGRLSLAVFLQNGICFLNNVQQGNEKGQWQWLDIATDLLSK